MYTDPAAYAAHLEQFGFKVGETLDEIILHVHSMDNLYFRIGTWDEVVEPKENDCGNGLVCQLDITALGKEMLHRSKLDRIPQGATLQIISGRVMSEESLLSPAGKGERFVYDPILALETDLPSLADIRDEYLDIAKHGGILRKPNPPRVISEDVLNPPQQSSSLPKIKIRHDYFPKAPRMNSDQFVSNWSNLIARKRYSDEGRLTDHVKAMYPLSDNFNNWAKKNWDIISEKLDNPCPFICHESGSEQDLLNKGLNERNPYIAKMGVFPYRKDGVWETFERTPMFQSWLKNIDAKIAEYNPRASRYSEPIVDEDSGEWLVMPQLIGDYTNEHFAGVDEYGDDTYLDFDADGVFLPMGNPQNSTDYQDDFDPDDLQSQSWQSLDSLDDHHYQEAYYTEVGVTETPHFNKENTDEIEWVSQPHADSMPPVERHSDIDFVTDAKNWLERGRLIQDAQTADAVAYILQRYPVSHGFSAYIDEQGIDWETTSEKLTEFLESAPNGDTPAVPVPVEVEECPFDDYDPHEHDLTAYDLFGDTLADRLSSGEYGFQLG